MARKTNAEQADELAAALGLSIQEGLNKKFKNTNYKVGEKALASQSVDEYFRKAFDWNGISGASTHSFRKSRLNHLHTQGWNLTEIQHISGHSTLKALEYYLEADKNNTFNKYKNLFEEEVLI